MDKLYEHQSESIDLLLQNPYFGLFLEMGLGKSRIVVESAQKLKQSGIIDNVIVICPSSVRSVWYSEELGELTKFHVNPFNAIEYHTKPRYWQRLGDVEPLNWYITNYEFTRIQDDRGKFINVKPLVKLLGNARNLLVLDESSCDQKFQVASI